MPPPASRMCGKAALDSKNGALRFTESVRSQPSTSSSSTVPGASVPAAFTNTSRRPNASTVRPTASAVSFALARSMGRAKARRPISVTSLTLPSSSLLLATIAMSAPARVREIVVALPSPLLAPVTSAALPCSVPTRLLVRSYYSDLLAPLMWERKHATYRAFHTVEDNHQLPSCLKRH
jgi:hypothetical protein